MQRMTLKIDDLRIEGNSRDGITHRSVGDVTFGVEDVPRSYEEICEDSRIAVQTGDDAGWRIGDNAIEVTQRYGDHTLADYAREIGKPKSTVYESAQMSRYWEPSARAELAEDCPNVTRSHMRKVLFMHDPDKARWAVEKCSERGWTVDQFGYILKRYKRLKGIGKPSAVRERSASFDVGWNAAPAIGDLCPVRFGLEDYRVVEKLITDHPKARIELVVTWTEAPNITTDSSRTS